MKIRIHNSGDNWTALLLALTPFLKNYRISFLNVNLATFIFLCLIAIELVYLVIGKRKEQHLKFCFSKPFLIVMSLYMIVEYLIIHSIKSYQGAVLNNFSDIISFIIIMYGLIMVTSRVSVCRQFKHYIVQISCIMSVVVIMQTVLYYLFGITLSEGRQFLLPFSNFFEESVTRSVRDSSMVINGLFRPSALFLEPAYFTQYCSLALCTVLFENTEKDKNSCISILISIGMILTTSGLGIASVGLIWGIKYLFDVSTLGQRKVVNTLIIAMCLLIAAVVLYNTIDFFASAVNRVLILDDNNALLGRVGSAIYLEQLRGMERIFGTGYKHLLWSTARNTEFYMTGIVEIQYCQGIVGLAIFSVMLIITLGRMIVKKLIKSTMFIVFLLFVIFLIGCSIISPAQLVLFLPFFVYFNEKIIT